MEEGIIYLFLRRIVKVLKVAFERPLSNFVH